MEIIHAVALMLALTLALNGVIRPGSGGGAREIYLDVQRATDREWE